jgi:hypothetical protein
MEIKRNFFWTDRKRQISIASFLHYIQVASMIGKIMERLVRMWGGPEPRSRRNKFLIGHQKNFLGGNLQSGSSSFYPMHPKKSPFTSMRCLQSREENYRIPEVLHT